MNLVRFSIAVEPEIKEKIEKMADKEKRSIASMARVLIEEAIATRENQK